MVCRAVFIGSDFWWSFPFGLSAACHWHFRECLPRYGNSRHGIGSHLPHVLQAGRAQDERPGSESGGRTSPGRSLTGVAAECRVGGSESRFAKFQGVEKSPRECRRIRLRKGLFCKRIQCGCFFSGQIWIILHSPDQLLFNCDTNQDWVGSLDWLILHSVCDRSVDWLTVRSIDWLIDWWSIQCVNDWLIDWLMIQSVCDWLIDWLVNSSIL